VRRLGITAAAAAVGAAALVAASSAGPGKTRPVPILPFIARFNISYTATIAYSHRATFRASAGYCDTPSNETVRGANFGMTFTNVKLGMRKPTPVAANRTLAHVTGTWSDVGEYVLPGGCSEQEPQAFRCTGKVGWHEDGTQVATVFLATRGNGKTVTLDLGLPEVQETGRSECLQEPSDAVGGPTFGLLDIAPLYRNVRVTISTKLLQAKWQSFAPLQATLPKVKVRAACGGSQAACTPTFFVARKLVLKPR
jgi:hypothetical protein